MIRHNGRPSGHAELRLAIKAGSAHEMEEQSGVAHFLEHMLFNGTERYPKNELLATLQNLGIDFGPDINAYTSVEETVYLLSFPLEDAGTGFNTGTGLDSSTGLGLFETALDVLVQWASHATLNPSDVDQERGVVQNELLANLSGETGQVNDYLFNSLLSGTPYFKRNPAGTAEAIAEINSDTLRDFYQTWYRPDRMAIIAVGDFEPDVVEGLIRQSFAELAASDTGGVTEGTGAEARNEGTTTAPADITFEYSPPQTVEVEVQTAPDSRTSSFYLSLPHTAFPEANSRSGIRDELLSTLAFEMISTRLGEDILQDLNPASNAGTFDFSVTSTMSIPTLAAAAPAAEIEKVADCVARELERVRQYGYSQEEFEIAVGSLQNNLDTLPESLPTRQHHQYSTDLTNYFLDDAPLPSQEQLYEISTQILSEITPEEVWAWLVRLLESVAPQVLIIGPENTEGSKTGTEKSWTGAEESGAGTERNAAETSNSGASANTTHLPSSARIEELFQTARSTTLPARPNSSADPQNAGQPTLLEPPQATPIVSETELEENITEIILANGVRVLHKPTTISAGSVSVSATSPGGESLIPAEDFISWDIPESAVQNSGFGDLSIVETERFLSDKTIEFEAFIGYTREGFTATADTDDLEALLAIINRTMTAPKVDDLALEMARDNWTEFLQNSDTNPRFALWDALFKARYGDNIFFTLAPTTQRLESMNPIEVQGIFADRFANAADFTFIFVGDVELEVVRDLASRYLGTLLTDPDSKEQWQDHEPDPPAGVVTRTVRAGTENQGGIWLLFSVPLEAPQQLVAEQTSEALEEYQRSALLQQIVENRLQDLIREDLSATYSPTVVIEATEEPSPVVEALLQITLESDRVDEIAEIVIAELTGLADSLVKEEYDMALAELRQDYNLVSNPFWIDTIRFAVENPRYNQLRDYKNRREVLRSVTFDDMVDFARRVFPRDQYIRINLLERE